MKGPAILAVEVTPAPAASPSTPPGRPAAPPRTSEPKPAGPKGAAVIIGNSGFIRNTYVGLVGNRDLFTSAVAWLTESGNLVSIAPRTSPFDPFIVGGSEGRYLFLGGVIALPLALLLFGGSVYLRRRTL